ncbi:hypothetical protein ACFQEQ_13695 [Halolamina salina]|uniref:hypothetical protein n=1 Tax=Halolamina salina TaxID=1220023 RepID=UPI0036239BD5
MATRGSESISARRSRPTRQSIATPFTPRPLFAFLFVVALMPAVWLGRRRQP